MTTPRRNPAGQTPFGAWVQTQPGLESHQFSMALTDADYLFHKYRAQGDGLGNREVQLSMMVELKTHAANPTRSQLETLFFHHQRLCSKGKAVKLQRIGHGPVSVWHFGVFILKLRGVIPKDNEIEWGVFDKHGSLYYSRGTVKGLIRLLRFDLRPDNPRVALSLRRHHKTQFILASVPTELGFCVEEIIKISS